MGKYVVGITGASGSIYADRLVRQLLAVGQQVILTITGVGIMVMQQELGLDLKAKGTQKEKEDCLKDHFSLTPEDKNLEYYDVGSIGAPIASGSYRVDGMVVIPCTMATVSAIANGASGDLLERAADVMLKERRTLIVVPREAPFSTIHLKNLLELSQNNVLVIPASPSFYHHPGSIVEMVDFFVGRIMDQLGIDNSLVKRWTGM